VGSAGYKEKPKLKPFTADVSALLAWNDTKPPSLVMGNKVNSIRLA